MIKKLKSLIFRGLIPFLKITKIIEWHFYKKKYQDIKIVVGAGGTNFDGWLQTDIWHLNLTKADDFKRLFGERKIDNILAEHVLEHLTVDEIRLMLRNIKLYASQKFRMRVAVPDGFHKDQTYREAVKPGGTGYGSDDHKHLFTYKSLTELFREEGYSAYLIEYWDDQGVFHKGYSEDGNGYISRSFLNDDRNKNGEPVYTSLIIDFMLADQSKQQ